MTDDNSCGVYLLLRHEGESGYQLGPVLLTGDQTHHRKSPAVPNLPEVEMS